MHRPGLLTGAQATSSQLLVLVSGGQPRMLAFDTPRCFYTLWPVLCLATPLLRGRVRYLTPREVGDLAFSLSRVHVQRAPIRKAGPSSKALVAGHIFVMNAVWQPGLDANLSPILRTLRSSIQLSSYLCRPDVGRLLSPQSKADALLSMTRARVATISALYPGQLCQVAGGPGYTAHVCCLRG